MIFFSDVKQAPAMSLAQLDHFVLTAPNTGKYVLWKNIGKFSPQEHFSPSNKSKILLSLGIFGFAGAFRVSKITTSISLSCGTFLKVRRVGMGSKAFH